MSRAAEGINWTSPGYKRGRCSEAAARNRRRCDVCREPIVAGDDRIIGPRGTREVHARCVDGLRFDDAAGRAILATLRDLDPSALSGCYGIDIDAPDKAPLDEAVSWYLTGVRR